ncbi:MAG: hypothetical protein A3H98_04735, partial [Bacteroidetes bacterium RIFCSPLOWO2_02_FULL_36_8]
IIVSLYFVKVYGYCQEVKTYSYWQQEVNYKIQVRLNDVNHILNAYEEIEYINHSPDTLTEIYFHLWPNAFKNNKTAFAKQQINSGSNRFNFSGKSQKGFIDSLDFKINDKKVILEVYQKMIDVVKITLPEPLLPEKKITITTPFRVKIPESFSRLGKTNDKGGKLEFVAGPQGIAFKPRKRNNSKTSYQITQWYPKPAVYDKNGWHPMPYLDQGEFYSEFGKFEVHITVPKNYIVGATGIMDPNNEESAWMEKREKETRERIRDGRIISHEDLIKQYKSGKKSQDLSFENTFTDTAYKTLVFRQDRIHDFAFFLDKDFHAITDSVTLPFSKRVVKTCVLFTGKEASLWKDAVQYVNDAVYYYSLWNGEYPYNRCTAVEGALSAGGGMEYPMITIISSSFSPEMLDNVITHEVGHNWFYGILGTNERKYSWLDEGINSYFDNRYMNMKKDKYKKPTNKKMEKLLTKMEMDEKDATQLFAMEAMYRFNASRNLDQPMNLSADEYTSMNYGCIVYGKSALVLNYLAGYLGQEKFDTCMHRYFAKWKFRHPYPEDIEYIFEETTGENLDWFFQHVIGTKAQLDFAIKDIDNSGIKRDNISNDTLYITVKNNSGFSAPVEIGFTDENENILYRKWSKPFENECVFKIPNGTYRTAILDPDRIIPEVNRQNNRMKVKGIFRKCEPFRMQLGLDAGNGKHTNLYWFPVSGYNTTDGTLLGLAFYNSAFPKKRFYYCLAPMYGFSEKKLKGFATVNYNWYPQKVFSNIRFGVDVMSFSVFRKINPSISFTINPKHLRDSPIQKININYHFIDFDNLSLNSDNYSIQFHSREGYKFSYRAEYSNAIRKWYVELGATTISTHWNFFKNDSSVNSFQPSPDYTILQGEFFMRRAYLKKDFIGLRLYQGLISKNREGMFEDENINGNADYLFEETLIDRVGSTPLFRHQTLIREDGLKSKMSKNYFENISALNITIDFPKLPFGFFTDFLFFKVHNDDENLYNSSGIYIPIIRDYFEIYFPIWFKDLNGYNFSDKITGNKTVYFTLKIDGMNIYEMLEKLR